MQRARVGGLPGLPPEIGEVEQGDREFSLLLRVIGIALDQGAAQADQLLAGGEHTRHVTGLHLRGGELSQAKRELTLPSGIVRVALEPGAGGGHLLLASLGRGRPLAEGTSSPSGPSERSLGRCTSAAARVSWSRGLATLRLHLVLDNDGARLETDHTVEFDHSMLGAVRALVVCPETGRRREVRAIEHADGDSLTFPRDFSSRGDVERAR